MSKALIFSFLFLGILASSASGQSLGLENASADTSPSHASSGDMPIIQLAPVLPRMAPELALQSFLSRSRMQMTDLGGYSALTVIEADLPSTKQSGRYELRRSFEAPKSLAFSAIRFIGDNFVKSNVIVRLLQSEVDHVGKGEGAQTAINEDNYKFKYKEVQQIEGDAFYAYEVKPRRKRTGLFKGRLYINALTGSIRRAEGTMVKSPSFFIKKIEFVQDYADFESFSLPVRLHSVSRTRLVGNAVVNIQYSDYQPRRLAHLNQSSASAASPGNQ